MNRLADKHVGLKTLPSLAGSNGAIHLKREETVHMVQRRVTCDPCRVPAFR